MVQLTSPIRGAAHREKIQARPPEAEKKPLPDPIFAGSNREKIQPSSDRDAKWPPEAEKKPLPDPIFAGSNRKKIQASPDRDAKPPPEREKKPLPDLDSVRQPIFVGFFFCLLGISHTSEIREDITSRGGKIVEASDFEVCTHILINGYHAGMTFEGSKVVSKEWLQDCCKQNKVNPVPEDCMQVLCKKYHQLFVCPLDESRELFTFSKAAERCKKKTFFVNTPGSHRETHRSLLTDEFLTLLVKKSYILLRLLHQAGLTLNGSFGAEHFIIYEALGEVYVRFGYIHEDAVKPITPEGETLDVDRFEAMIRVTIFRESVIGPSLNLWLYMLHDADVKDLLVESVLLLDLAGQSEKFSSLYDSFVNANVSVRDAVETDLQEYIGWQDVIESSDCNLFLQDTFYRPQNGRSGSERYKPTVKDLLRLLRNSRHHDALPFSAQFALVIRHNFTNLLADLQKALFLASKRFA